MNRGITNLFGQVQESVDLLADLTIRAEFINKLRHSPLDPREQRVR
jgi:hypothetical protein